MARRRAPFLFVLYVLNYLDLVSRAGSRVLGVIGAGVQARYQVVALKEVCSPTEVRGVAWRAAAISSGHVSAIRRPLMVRKE